MRKPPRHVTLSICSSLLFLGLMGATQGKAAGEATVQFEIDRNRVIIPTSVNGSKPLRLILDTGMRFDGVYLFHRDARNLIDTTGAVEVQVGGAGSGEASKATMVETGCLRFGEVSITNQRIVISHSEQTQGFPTDGVIGWNLFGHYIVEMDYDRAVILLHDTAQTLAESGWQTVPIDLREGLPFLSVIVEVTGGESVPAQVYIDLASEEALELLMGENQRFTLPDSTTRTYLGTGLSGDIYGSRGRVESVRIGNFELPDVRTAFAPAAVRSKQRGADGVLGNDLIRRFNVIFDYPHKQLLLRPNKMFGRPFEEPASD